MVPSDEVTEIRELIHQLYLKYIPDKVYADADTKQDAKMANAKVTDIWGLYAKIEYLKDKLQIQLIRKRGGWKLRVADIKRDIEYMQKQLKVINKFTVRSHPELFL